MLNYIGILYSSLCYVGNHSVLLATLYHHDITLLHGVTMGTVIINESIKSGVRLATC